MHAQSQSDVIRLSTVSINQTPLDWKGNENRILRAIEQVSPDNPDILLFPELCITGYGCEDAFYSEYVAHKAIEIAQKIARDASKFLPDSLIIVGIPFRFRERIYNCAAILHGGKIRGIIPKQNLAGDGIHYEQRWFTAWRGEPETVRIDGESIPIGPLVVDLSELRIALEICEDCWVPNRPADHYTKASPDIILCPSASHFAFGKEKIRRNIALDSSRSYGCVYVIANLLGNEAGRAIYDGCVIVASLGSLIYEARRFSFEDIQIHNVDIDISSVRTARGRTFSYKEQNDHPIYKIVELARMRPALTHASTPELTDELSKEEEFLQAVSLGLFDYLRKSHSRGYVVSLSGGADSAACAVLVERMVRLAVYELGFNRTLEKLGLPVPPTIADTVRDTEGEIATLTPLLLHTIYQGTSQSGQVTENAARVVASALHADHHLVAIEDSVRLYVEKGESILARKLTWEKDDLSLQNIQARARSPMAWLFANTTGSILITTSNRSEGSVGYCTMDGDTSGGVAPIAGVDKDYLRTWLRWMEKTGDCACGPIPALAAINDQEPTAELKPGQTDERDLMPYVLLEAVEALAVRDKKSPVEIYRILRAEGQWDPPFLKKSLVRFFKLWTQNQWKRERLAPSFHLDDRNIDPRTWCRFPILSGGYELELEELAAEP